MEKNSQVRYAQAWVGYRCMMSWEEGSPGVEKDSGVKCVQAWVEQGHVTT